MKPNSYYGFGLTRTANKSKSLTIFIFLLVISLIIIISDITLKVSILKNFIGFVIFPSQKCFSEFLNKTSDASSNIKQLFIMYQENKILKEKLNRMRTISKHYSLLVYENKRLENMLEYQSKANEYLKAAKVIGRSINDWYRVIIIDKGTKDGIKKGYVVISGKEPLPEIIGQVIETNIKFSKVLLLTDSNSSIAVYLNRTFIDGIVEGKNEPMMSLNYVKSDSDVVIGDMVISSGLGGIFPSGLYVGNVYKIVKNPKGNDFRSIIIKPAVDLSRLRDVFVILEKKND